MVVCDPNSNCFEVGYESTSSSYTYYGPWPSNWDYYGSGTNGPPAAELDVSEFGLAGTGTWSVTFELHLDSWAAAQWAGSLTLEGPCEPIIEGCTDSEACNYNPEATDDDGSCVYADPVCTCTSGTEFDVWLASYGFEYSQFSGSIALFNNLS